MASEEDFTFPTIYPFPCTIDSPPLWQLSPNSSSHEDLEEETKNYSQRNMGFDDEDEEEEEEKMDMLWEDFNEELGGNNYRSTSDMYSSGEMVALGCVHGLKLPRSGGAAGGALVSPRRPAAAGMVAFIRVLKRLFLIHNSHRPHKKYAR